MAQGPCLNPNCKSHGAPHPNCRCYGPGMADGGTVGDYCASSRPHMRGCQYYAEGGEVGNDSIPAGAIPLEDFDPQSNMAGQGFRTVGSALGSALSDKETSDSIEPDYNSPIDLAAGAVGARLGSAMGREFGSVVGNEVGAVGRNVNPLPMDDASRLARAKAAGYDISRELYHGTKSNIEEFKLNANSINGNAYGKGVYLTTRPDDASHYSYAVGTKLQDKEGSNVLPLYAKIKNAFNLDNAVDIKLKNSMLKDGVISKAQAQEINDNFSLYGHMINKMTPSKFTDVLAEHGYDALEAPHAKTTVIFNPEQLRSKFAEFNPKNAKSGKLSFAEGGAVLKENYNYSGYSRKRRKKDSGYTQNFAEGGMPLPQGAIPADEFQVAENTPLNSPQLSENIPPISPNLGKNRGGLPEGAIPEEEFESQEEKYGTPIEQAKTALEGFGQGIAGPLAPMAERAMGVDPEGIRARKEANPWIHGGAELGGFATSMMTGTGVGSAIAHAGEAAVGATHLAEASTYGAKIASRAVQAATEMGLLSASDETSKMILQDPDQSAQTALTNVALSSLLGAAGGSALGAISPLWSSQYAEKTGQLLADLRGTLAKRTTGIEPTEAVHDELSHYYNTIKASADEVYGPSGIKAQEAAKVMPELNDKMVIQTSDIASKLQDTVSRMSESPYAYPQRLTSKLEGDLANYTSKISSPGAASSDLFNATQDLKQQLQSYAKYDKFIKPTDEAYDFIKDAKGLAHDLKESLEDKAVWGKAAERQQVINKAFTEFLPALKDFERKFTSEISGQRAIDPGKISTYVNQLGKPSAEIKQSMLGNFLESSEKYRKVIADSHISLGNENPMPNMPLAAVRDTLEEQTAGMKLANAILRHADEASGKIVGAGVGGYLGHHVGMTELGGMLGAYSLGPFFKSTIPAVLKTALSLTADGSAFRAAADYAAHVAKGENLIGKAAKSIFKSGSEIMPENVISTTMDERNKLDSLLKKTQENPMLNIASGGKIGHYLPDHGKAIAQTAQRATQYLKGLRPHEEPMNPLDSKPVVTKMQKTAYNNALDIANKPLSVISKIKDGTITLQDIGHLKTMYPQLYTSLSNKMMSEMIEHIHKGETVPYKTRIGVSLFMGKALDSTMIPASIMAAQPKSQQPQQPQGGQQQGEGVKHSTANLNKISGLAQTSSQARAAQRQK